MRYLFLRFTSWMPTIRLRAVIAATPPTPTGCAFPRAAGNSVPTTAPSASPTAVPTEIPTTCDAMTGEVAQSIAGMAQDLIFILDSPADTCLKARAFANLILGRGQSNIGADDEKNIKNSKLKSQHVASVIPSVKKFDTNAREVASGRTSSARAWREADGQRIWMRQDAMHGRGSSDATQSLMSPYRSKAAMEQGPRRVWLVSQFGAFPCLNFISVPATDGSFT